jgi:hypothetical protein
LTTLLSVLFLSGSFLKFIDRSGSFIKITFAEIIRVTSEQGSETLDKSFALSLFFILIPVLSAVIIFLFKNRSLQLRLAAILIVLIVVFIMVSGIFAYLYMKKYHAEILPGFRMIIPFLQLIFSVLAYRGIKKDDNLVKSYDRLR